MSPSADLQLSLVWTHKNTQKPLITDVDRAAPVEDWQKCHSSTVKSSGTGNIYVNLSTEVSTRTGNTILNGESQSND
ncbi:hypothetical protein XELAEV_18018081mg [Xenopus laevis]|uniref:Uncharacterized protein n=1 Tax=Xenopus laevis TaxID=8355 RepID=A0A974DEG2_XENLA|nr:hypothetical protein XELAEV_18018081mg [Xenopus laevis]